MLPDTIDKRYIFTNKKGKLVISDKAPKSQQQEFKRWLDTHKPQKRLVDSVLSRNYNAR